MKASKLIDRLQQLIAIEGDQDVNIDTGMCLCEIEECDLDASDRSIVIWAGDLVEVA